MPERVNAPNYYFASGQRSLDIPLNLAKAFVKMKSVGPIKHFVLAFVMALVLYAVFYTGIEYRRTRLGPWQVTLSAANTNTPVIIINQPKLGITNVTLVFSSESGLTTNTMLVFDPPRPVPFDIPYGQCIFLDTTFQPGTVVLNLFGHEIQLIPRILTVDKKEYPWKSETIIDVSEKGVLGAPAKR